MNQRSASYWLRFVALIVLLMMMIRAAPALAAEGVVEGKLRNGTAGAAIPSWLEVTLEKSDTDGRPEAIQQSSVDSAGTFRFAAIDASSAYSYTVSAKYREVTYRSAPLSLATGKASESLELTVFETTDSDAAVGVDLAHAVLQPDQANGGMWVIEVLVLNNGGDRTYVGDPERTVDGKRPILRFSLPAGVHSPQPLQGLDPDGIFDIINGFADPTPLYPGRREIAYSYMLPFQGNDATYSRAVDYPTARFAVLMADGGGRVEAVRLAQGDPAEIGDQRYQTFVAEDLPADDSVSLRLTAAAASASSPVDLAKIVGGVAVLAIIGGVAIYVRRRRFVPVVGRALSAEPARESLIAAIAELDDSFEAGEIEEDEYRAERTECKRQLAKLLRAHAEG